MPAVTGTQINIFRNITQHGVQELEEWMEQILISLSVQWREGQWGQSQAGLLSQGPQG